MHSTTPDTGPTHAGANGTDCSSGWGTEWREGWGDSSEKEWMTWLDTLSSAVHCVSYTDHGIHVVEEHCRKE